MNDRPSRSEIPLPAHRPGERLHGFRIDAVTPIDDVKALCYEAVHEASGARVVHVHCHDEENLFSVGFATPPEDSTGVAHILEHSVLAGSERFPVKDAFNELARRTLSTFLNAMTWPDRTVYPTCSAVRKDLFHLAAVYADLVFHPRLREATFLQEGWHLEVDPAGALTISGVVYNEMKGVYASPESLLERELQRRLFPDTTYGHDSGGDPEEIPSLTYERFRAFHRRYYVPSNARFLLYGDVPLAEHLAFLAPILAACPQGAAARVEVPLQPRWAAPRAEEVFYAVGPEDDLARRTYVVTAFLANETADVEETLLLEVLAEALAGTAAGPVRKALIDSGLGADFHPGAVYASDLRQGALRFGLRGTEAGHAERIEAIVLETLERTAREGLDRELVEAALHQIEFAGRAITPPFPIMLLVRMNPPWYYGADPKAGLRFATLVGRVRERLLREPRALEERIRRFTLENPHRLRLTARPSPALGREREAAFRARMAERKAALAPSEIERIAAEARALREEQEAPDAPEAIATLPRLEPADIPRRVRTVPTAPRTIAGVEALEHEVFSNGIAYLGLAFDVRGLEEEWVPWLPLVGKALLGMGAAGLGYEEMARRQGRLFGALGWDLMAGADVRTGSVFERMAIDAQMLGRNIPEAVRLLAGILGRPDPTDRKRLKDLVLEAASRRRSQLVPAGSFFALVRAAAGLGLPQRRREQWNGVTQVKLAIALAAEAERRVDEMVERLAALERRLFTRSRVLVSLAGDRELLAPLRREVEALLRALPEGAPEPPRTAPAAAPARDTGIAVPAAVNFCAAVVPAPKLLDPAAPAVELLAAVVESEYAYKRIRLQGGAYGGHARYDPFDGTLALTSYRDPNLEETFAVFDDLARWLRSGAIGDEAIDASRLGTIADFDQPLSPGQQLGAARRRHLAQVTDDDRRAYRNGLLGYGGREVQDLAIPAIERALAAAPRAAVGSAERLARANETLARKLEIVTVD
jgi:hypothetical protein